MNDPVNHPEHYTSGKVECIDAMVEAFGVEAVKRYCLCNAFKYHWRHSMKNGQEDIEKATWYMDKYRELMNGEPTQQEKHTEERTETHSCDCISRQRN